VLDVRSSALHGRGCFASAAIEAGDVIGRMEGEPTGENGDHVIWTADDSGLRVTNHMRYLNHSRDPNAEVDDATLEVIALRPIAPGEEVTIDYGDEWDDDL
jgi:uncharacterized protein